MINVSKPYLPPMEEYTKYLRDIWSTGWLTNNGPLITRLEDEQKRYLGVKHVIIVSSGTVALQIAIKACELQGEVITTPFSHVAAVNALLWGNCQPVFVDIEEGSFLIDPGKIEAAVTNRTSAILATHVYGYPCKAKEIESIAAKHNVKVIYDGAHAFGVKLGTQSIFNYGDVSAVSFHTTKLFHTIEGGAIITNDEKIASKCVLLRNFGYKDTDPQMAGINGKNSEFHAAMGLCNLSKMPDFIAKRAELSKLYRLLLQDLPLKFPDHPANIDYNYAYFPVLFPSQEEMMGVMNSLSNEEIYARRYFYPSLNTLPYCKGAACPISEDISERIVCLPLYYDLTLEDVRTICGLIFRSFNAQVYAKVS